MTDPTPIHTALTAAHLLGSIDWSRLADDLWLELSAERDIEWRTEDEYRAEMDRNWWSE